MQEDIEAQINNFERDNSQIRASIEELLTSMGESKEDGLNMLVL